MADVTLRNARTSFENSIIDTLQLAYGRRLTAAADIAALRALPSTSIWDRTPRVVTSKGVVYLWRPGSLSADDGDVYVQPSDVASGKPGRWVKTTSAVGDGYLKHCDLYNDDPDTIEQFEQRLFGQMPAMLLSFERAKHTPKSSEPGALYWCEYHFTLFVIGQNARGEQTVRQGSSVPAELALDPGTAAMIGDAKASLAGLSGEDLSLPDIAYIQIGDEYPVIKDLARARFVEALDLVVYATLTNADATGITTLADPYEFNMQLQLADSSSSVFDADNQVQSDGLRFALGTGLTQSFAGGAVVVNGATVTVAGASHLFSASKVTYRDLSAAGALTYTETSVGDEPPTLGYGLMRLGVTVTDATGVRLDRILASTLVDFGPVNKVERPTLTSISVSPPTITIPHGTNVQFTATGTYEDGSTADVTYEVAWHTSDTLVAAFADRTGVASTPAAGTANITATLNGVTSPAATITAT